MRSVRDIFRSYAVFDADGRHVNGTDKESNHRYGDAYERIITNNFSRGPAEPRNVVRLMMEIGVADGSSLLAWREVFPNATIVGMDIHHSDKAHGERIEFYLGDQRSKMSCDRAVGGRQFDFICEDATHNMADTLLTLLYLWPSVRPGGLYIVEEWADIGSLMSATGLWPHVEIVNTDGPFGGNEPLVVFRKPL